MGRPAKIKAKPEFTRKINRTASGETEDDAGFVSVSGKSGRPGRSKKSFLDDLVEEYWRSEKCQDWILQGLDAHADSNGFKLRGVTARKVGSDLLQDNAIELSRVSRLISSPVEAFRIAQTWRQGRQKKIERFGWKFRISFFEEINKLVAPECAKGGAEADIATQLSALDVFLSVSASLLKAWRSAGKLATWWWYENSTQVVKMQQAKYRLRRSYEFDWRYATPRLS